MRCTVKLHSFMNSFNWFLRDCFACAFSRLLLIWFWQAWVNIQKLNKASQYNLITMALYHKYKRTMPPIIEISLKLFFFFWNNNTNGQCSWQCDEILLSLFINRVSFLVHVYFDIQHINEGIYLALHEIPETVRIKITTEPIRINWQQLFGWTWTSSLNITYARWCHEFHSYHWYYRTYLHEAIFLVPHFGDGQYFPC